MVAIIPLNQFKKYLTQAGKICSDKFDIPYVALSLSFKKAPIWSNDKVLKRDCQKFSIKVLSTKEVKELIFK
jgi:predicted nucleic acid-binding protein